MDTIICNVTVSFTWSEQYSRAAIDTKLSQFSIPQLEKIVNAHQELRKATFLDGCNIQMELQKYTMDDLHIACKCVGHTCPP